MPNFNELSVLILACVTAQGTFVNSSPSPVKSLFCTDMVESFEWQDLEQRQRIGDCSVHPPRWGLCDQPMSSHQTFLLEVEHRQCVFCKERLSFWFASRLRTFWEVSIKTMPPGFWYHFRRTFRIWVLRNVCGCKHFSVLQIICELLQPFRKISQTFDRISIAIPLLILVLGFWEWSAPVSWS